MELFEQLTIEDREKIEKYIKICTGKSIKVPLEKILENWALAKKSLYEAFDKKLIIEKDIEVTKTTSDLCQEYNKKIFDEKNKKAESFIRSLDVALKGNIVILDKNGDIEIRTNSYDYTPYSPYQLFINPLYIISNSLTFDANQELINNLKDKSVGVVLKDETIFKVPKGMKTMRFFSKMVKEFDLSKENFEQFRLFQSMLTNQKVVKGKLCLSIHPLDYMTMSDNDSSWTSCMSWLNHGCYHQGTVEMMNSKTVIVGYVKSLEDSCIGGITWNNKKWRQLFIVDPAFACGIKSYPYINYDLTEEVLKMIRKELKGYDYIEEIGRVSLDPDEYGCIDIMEKDPKYCLGFSPITNMMYNDFGTVTEHPCIINPNLLKKENECSDVPFYWCPDDFYEYNYSGVDQCMICGESINKDFGFDFDSEEIAQFIVCNECANRSKCRTCGRFIEGEDLTEVDGHLYCSMCLNEYTHKEFFTGKTVFDPSRFSFNCLRIMLTDEDFENIIKNKYNVYSRVSSMVTIFYAPKEEGFTEIEDYCVGSDSNKDKLFVENLEYETWEDGEEIMIKVSSLTKLGLERLLFCIESRPDLIKEEIKKSYEFNANRS